MNYLEVLTAIFATFFFGIIFSLTGKKLIYSSFAGGLGWYTHLLFFKELAYSKTASFVISAVVITVFSEIIGRIEKNNGYKYINSSINSIGSWWWNLLYYVFFC